MDRTPPADKLNSTAASLLGFLHRGPASGYELVGIAEDLIGDFWSLTRSQVYRELATLASRDLVTAGPVGPRSRRPYELTDAGRAAFATWLAEPPGAEQIRFPLLLTLAFGTFIDRDTLRGYVAEHRVLHERRLKQYLAIADDIADKLLRSTVRFGIHYEQGVLAWMDEVAVTLDALDAEGE
ncbi:PadR family transcriptional regulator [Catenulispora subtropica]|uniref:Helix-turn-helix transcriptional regulator n=1 Tax=Catenulispora subtropica TaxID=450798 RepID=A0ABP5ELW4_9ACTN